MTDETEELPGGETGAHIGPAMSEPGASSYHSKEVILDRTGDAVRAIHEAMGESHRDELEFLSHPGDDTTIPVMRGIARTTPVPADWFDEYRDNPKRRKGTAKLTTLDSFIELTNRQKAYNSVIFANDSIGSPSLTAVFDYNPHGASRTGWMQHRAHYSLPFSDEWKAWHGYDGNWFNMAEFAAFVEERINDVVADPNPTGEAAKRFLSTTGSTMATPSKLFELSRGLEIHEGSQVVNKQNLTTGEVQFTFETKQTDASGAPLSLPKAFVIAIPVFQRSDVFDQIIVRLRYRIQNGKVHFGYELWRADLVFAQAFNDAVTKAAADTGLPVYMGSPEA